MATKIKKTTKKNEAPQEKLNVFESQWDLVQQGGSTKFSKVNTLINKANKKHAGDGEFSETTLKGIHKALQLAVFGKTLPSKLFAWAE